MADINDHKHEVLIDRYLNNNLGAAEKAAFELFMMEDQYLFERVEFVATLKQQLVAEQDVFKKIITSPEPAASRKPVFALPFSTWLQQPLSWAASALIIVMGGQIFYHSQLSPAAMQIGSLVLIEGTRSNAAAVFGGPGPYLFQIDAGLGSYAEVFTVTLLDRASNEVVVQEQGLRADNNGWVRILIDDGLNGEYTVELGWQDNQGETQSRRSLIAIKPQ